MKYLILLLLTCIMLFANANKKIMNVVDIPFKEATMFNDYTNFMDVSIYAKTINDDMQKNFFEEEVEDDGIYPVLVYITNNSKEKVIIYAKDGVLNQMPQIQLHSIIKPYQNSVLTSKTVFATLANISSLGMRIADGGDKMADGHAQAHIEEIRNEFYRKSIKETLLYPGDTISGFLFFDKKELREKNTISMQIQFMNSIKKYTLESTISK